MTDEKPAPDPARARPDVAERVQRWIVFGVTIVMTLEVAWLLYEAQWLSAVLVVSIMAVILAPTLLGDRLPVIIPAEFQVLALLFTFAALFLGEVRDYYLRIWWWDTALHASSGFLLGVLGFLLIYVLNENRHIDLHMRPRFVALFAFLFAVAAGTLWEIFEFAMDQGFGANMQKEMFGDTSGLTDTMWDLIVDVLGALAISVYGWYYLRHPEQSFIERWVEKFIARNPRLFRNL